MKIVVLAAGTSTEREVSIVSGTNVCKALRSKGHQAILVDVFFGKEGADSATAFDGDYDVDAEAAYISSFNDQVKDAVASGREFFGPGVIELCKAADVVFMALHGANGEDGRVQAYFDLCGIPYTGTGYLSSAMAMDKGITKKIFLTSGVPTPRGVELKKGKDSTNLADHNMELPVVVKTCCGGSSVGVYITKTPEEYEEALQGAFSYEDEVVVEEYIEGREFSVGVVDGKAYPRCDDRHLSGGSDRRTDQTDAGICRGRMQGTGSRGLCKTGFPDERGRLHVLPRSQYAAGHDTNQSASTGGGSTGYRLCTAV